MRRNPYRWPSLFPKAGHTMTTDQWIEAVAPLFMRVPMRDRRKRHVARIGVLERRMPDRARPAVHAPDRNSMRA
jgi:hypothetical protein